MKEVMQQALDALEGNPISHAGLVNSKRAIVALRAALEQQAEPVAWMYQHEETGRTSFIAAWERKDGWKPSSTRMKLIGPLYLATAIRNRGQS